MNINKLSPLVSVLLIAAVSNVVWAQDLEASDAMIRIDSDNAVAYYRRGVAWGSTAQD